MSHSYIITYNTCFHVLCKQLQERSAAPSSASPCSLLRLAVVSNIVVSQAQCSITTFLCVCTHAHSFVTSLLLTRCTHSGGIRRFLTHGEKKSSPVCSVSHYLLPVRQSNCSQRRILVFRLKSQPGYSKLLACLQHSSRPLGHPLAVQLRVPLPVIPVVGYLSYWLTTTVRPRCSPLPGYPPIL